MQVLEGDAMRASLSHSVATRERRSANGTDEHREAGRELDERERGCRAESRRGEALERLFDSTGMRDGTMHRGVCYYSGVIREWLCTGWRTRKTRTTATCRQASTRRTAWRCCHSWAVI